MAVESAGEPSGSEGLPVSSQIDPEFAEKCKAESTEELKHKGNCAFKRAQLLKKTTAGKQYLDEAKSYYAQALRQLSDVPATAETLEMVCTLHSNLAAVFLIETPPAYKEAKAAAEIGLTVNPRHVKCLYRRAQATLEDNREGLPEEALVAALADFKVVLEVEPGNKQVVAESERIRRKLEAIEEARRIPTPEEIIEKIPPSLLERGADHLDTHGYVWGQNDSTIHIFVPARGTRMKKSKDVSVEPKASSLSLTIPAKACSAPAGEAVDEEADRVISLMAAASPDVFKLSGPLHKPIRPDDCSWQLEDAGLLLHVELNKRDADKEKEHWLCVWSAHPHTRAPSSEEKLKLEEMAKAACIADSREQKEELPAGAQEKLKGLRDAFPGMNIEWGDTSLDAYR